MFLAVRNGDRIGKIEKPHARRRIFGGDRLVSEVQAKAICARLADDACQYEGGKKKIQVGKLIGVAEVPKHASAGAALDEWIARVNGERRSAAGDHAGNGLAEAPKFIAKRLHRRERGLAKRRSLGDFGFADVSVIGVNSSGDNSRAGTNENI